MTGMETSGIVKVKISEKWFELQLSEICTFLNLENEDMIEIKLSIDKVKGNPVEWLKKKYLGEE